LTQPGALEAPRPEPPPAEPAEIAGARRPVTGIALAIALGLPLLYMGRRRSSGGPRPAWRWTALLAAACALAWWGGDPLRALPAGAGRAARGVAGPRARGRAAGARPGGRPRWGFPPLPGAARV